MNSDYDPVFLPNESIKTRKYKIGDKIQMRVMEVMDDGVKCMCDHGQKMANPEKEMGERATSRYRAAMNGEAEGY
jgi:hypothetical protein